MLSSMSIEEVVRKLRARKHVRTIFMLLIRVLEFLLRFLEIAIPTRDELGNAAAAKAIWASTRQSRSKQH